MNKKTNKLEKFIITLLVIIFSIIGLYYYSNNEDFNIEEDYYSELKNGKVRNGNDKN